MKLTNQEIDTEIARLEASRPDPRADWDATCDAPGLKWNPDFQVSLNDLGTVCITSHGQCTDAHGAKTYALAILRASMAANGQDERDPGNVGTYRIRTAVRLLQSETSKSATKNS